MMVHLNGQFLHQEKALISPDDRGFLFGDGVYEVVRASKGRLFRAKDVGGPELAGLFRKLNSKQ